MIVTLSALSTFTSILVTILGISIIICLHELGHLIFAKRYGVYCYEYSIGMGPKIFSKRPKNKETKFSLRWIPLGGYVSMAGEEEDESDKSSKNGITFTDPEDDAIPRERTLAGIKKHKQVMVMFAGVLMNFVIAFVLFFAKNITTKTPYLNSPYFTVLKDRNAHNSGLRTGDKFVSVETKIEGSKAELFNKVMTEQSEFYVTIKNSFNKSISNYNDLSYSLVFQKGDETVDLRPTEENDKLIRTFTVERSTLKDPSNPDSEIETNLVQIPVEIPVNLDSKVTEKDKVLYSYQLFGLQVKQEHLSFGAALAQSFVDFGMSIYNVFYALGSLFTPTGYQNVGGIVSLFAINDQAMKMGGRTVLQIWGLLSANIGVMNLIPFPSLDGWQIMIVGIEAARKKPISAKTKGIMNTIGMGILFALFGALLILDFMRL